MSASLPRAQTVDTHPEGIYTTHLWLKGDNNEPEALFPGRPGYRCYRLQSFPNERERHGIDPSRLTILTTPYFAFDKFQQTVQSLALKSLRRLGFVKPYPHFSHLEADITATADSGHRAYSLNVSRLPSEPTSSDPCAYPVSSFKTVSSWKGLVTERAVLVVFRFQCECHGQHCCESHDRALRNNPVRDHLIFVECSMVMFNWRITDFRIMTKEEVGPKMMAHIIDQNRHPEGGRPTTSTQDCCCDFNAAVLQLSRDKNLTRSLGYWRGGND